MAEQFSFNFHNNKIACAGQNQLFTSFSFFDFLICESGSCESTSCVPRIITGVCVCSRLLEGGLPVVSLRLTNSSNIPSERASDYSLSLCSLSWRLCERERDYYRGVFEPETLVERRRRRRKRDL